MFLKIIILENCCSFSYFLYSC